MDYQNPCNNTTNGHSIHVPFFRIIMGIEVSPWNFAKKNTMLPIKSVSLIASFLFFAIFVAPQSLQAQETKVLTLADGSKIEAKEVSVVGDMLQVNTTYGKLKISKDRLSATTRNKYFGAPPQEKPTISSTNNSTTAVSTSGLKSAPVSTSGVVPASPPNSAQPASNGSKINMKGTSAAPTGTSEWQQFRGPNGNGVSADTAINIDWKTKPPTLLWSVPLKDEGWSNPCVAGGVVFQMDHDQAKGEDLVRALDLQTGQEKWQTALPGLKRPINGYTSASPAFDDNRIYVINREMLVTCLDAVTGKQLWQRNALADFAAQPPEKAWGFNASPLIDENRLIIIPGGAEAAVVALNKETGETIWKMPGGPAGHASPIVFTGAGKKEYVVLNSEGLIGIDPVDGNRLWTLPHVTQFNQNCATPLAIDQQIFITSAFGVGSKLVELAGDNPAVTWASKELQARFSSPVCLKNAIYGGTDSKGELVCLDVATGKVGWKQPGFEFGPLASAGGVLVAINGKTGEVVLVEANAEKYNELGRISLNPAGTTWNNPVICSGRLLVRNKSTLFCFNVAP